MNFIYLLFIAFINSIDNIGIRVAFSIGGVKVQLVKNLLISFMAFAVSLLASYFGDLISHILSDELCSILSMILLSLMGINLIVSPYLKKKKEEKLLNTNSISYKQSITVGTALALDDIGGSVSVGLMSYNPLMVGLAFFIVSFSIFLSGNYMIKLFKKLSIGNIATTAAGIIMIIIGISQVVE
jgi:putative Mn2+ efflux pump MntP